MYINIYRIFNIFPCNNINENCCTFLCCNVTTIVRFPQSLAVQQLMSVVILVVKSIFKLFRPTKVFTYFISI